MHCGCEIATVGHAAGKSSHCATPLKQCNNHDHDYGLRAHTRCGGAECKRVAPADKDSFPA